MPCAYCGTWVKHPAWLNLGLAGASANPELPRNTSRFNKQGELLVCVCEVCKLLHEINDLHRLAVGQNQTEVVAAVQGSLQCLRAFLASPGVASSSSSSPSTTVVNAAAEEGAVKCDLGDIVANPLQL